MSETDGKRWRLAGRVGDVDDDEPRLAAIDGQDIALCKVAGEIYAIDNICSHEFACLTDGFVEGDQVECPLHQARFHIPTGKVLAAPATEDLRTFPVKVEGEDIYVAVEGD
jgi:3-phenylpropionate/trans-cinnamate dioxygenase ferredoxin subunit